MAVDVRGSRGSLGFYALIATAITGAGMGSAILFTAVVLVVISAFLINRLAGIPVPWWRPPTP